MLGEAAKIEQDPAPTKRVWYAIVIGSGSTVKPIAIRENFEDADAHAKWLSPVARVVRVLPVSVGEFGHG